MRSIDQARLQVGRVQLQRGGMTRVRACCPTISSAWWPDLTLRGCTSISAASRSVTWEGKEGFHMLWPVNRTDHMCHDIKDLARH